MFWKGIGSIVLIALILEGVFGHGRLSVPSSRGILKSPPKTIPQELAPVPVGLPLDAEFICRNDPAPDSSQYVALTAGQPTAIQWDFSAAHVGDCFAYLTYDGDKAEADMMWFKIAEYAECEKHMNTDIQVNISSYLPSCTHCIIRWEWYALHNRPNIEFYNQCFDVTIAGNPNGRLPGPQFHIPGHITEDGNQYRNGFPGPDDKFFFTGPPVATLDGAIDGDSSLRPCTQNSDCPSKVCQINKFCLVNKGLGSAGIAAIVFALLFLTVVVVFVIFILVNKKEIPYLKPFKSVNH